MSSKLPQSENFIAGTQRRHGTLSGAKICTDGVDGKPCEECLQVKRETGRRYWRKKHPIPFQGAKHPSIYTYQKGCRCEGCKAKNAEAQRLYRNKQSKKAPLYGKGKLICAQCNVPLATHPLQACWRKI